MDEPRRAPRQCQVEQLLQKEEKYKEKPFSEAVRKGVGTAVKNFLDSQDYVKEGERYFPGKGTEEEKRSVGLDLATHVKDWLQQKVIDVSSKDSKEIDVLDTHATQIVVPEIKGMIRNISQRKVTDFSNKPLIVKPTEEHIENKLRNVVEESIRDSGKKFSRRATGVLTDKVLQSFKSEKNVSAYLSDSERKRIKTSLDNTLEKAPSKGKVTADKSAFISGFKLQKMETEQKLTTFGGVEVKSKLIPENLLKEYKDKEITAKEFGTKVAGACYTHVSVLSDPDAVVKFTLGVVNEFQQQKGISAKEMVEFTNAFKKALGKIPERKPRLEDSRSNSLSNLKMGEKNLDEKDVNVRRNTSLSNIKLEGIDLDLTDIAKGLKNVQQVKEDKSPPNAEFSQAGNKNSHRTDAKPISKGLSWFQKLKLGKKDECKKPLLSSNSEQQVNVRG